MRKIKSLLFLLFLLCFSVHVSLAQETEQIDTAGFKTFLVEEGENIYLMKQYFLGIYTAGDTVLIDEDEKSNIQQAHGNHLGQLEKERKLCIAGPFGDDGDWRGMVILSVKSKEEAVEIMNGDPAVKRGTLNYILKPLWAGVGSKLF